MEKYTVATFHYGINDSEITVENQKAKMKINNGTKCLTLSHISDSPPTYSDGTYRLILDGSKSSLGKLISDRVSDTDKTRRFEETEDTETFTASGPLPDPDDA